MTHHKEPPRHSETQEWTFLVPANESLHPEVARELLDLAQKMYGDQGFRVIGTNTDDGVSFRVPKEIADQYMCNGQEPTPKPEEPEIEVLVEPAWMADPIDHSVGEVVAYLQTVSIDEQHRIIDAERSGKARKSLISWFDA